MRRIRTSHLVTSMAMAGNVVVLSPVPAGSADGAVFATPEVQRLLASQDELGTERPAVRGRVSASAGRKGGIVFAMAEPPPAFLDRLKVGDSYGAPLLGAARVGGDGAFSLRLPEEGDALGADPGESREVYLRFVSSDGGDVGVSVATLDVDHRRSVPRTAEVDIGRTEEIDVVGHGEDGGHLGCTTTVLGKGRAMATIGIAGTENSNVHYDFTPSRNQSTKLGFGVKIGSGGWSAGSGTYTVSTGASFSDNWGWRNAIGTYDYQAEVNTIYQRKQCSGQVCRGTCPTEYSHRAVSYTGGTSDPVKWGVTAVLPSSHCVPRAAGSTLTLSYSKASTRSVGLELAKLPFGSSVNVSSQAGYTSGTLFKFRTVGSGRQLCGRDGQPGGAPGFIMGK